MSASTLATAPASRASRARVALAPTPGQGETPEVTPAEFLRALARDEGLRGRHAPAIALALFVMRAAAEPGTAKGRRWGRTASLRRAIAHVDAARAVLDAVVEGEAP